MAARIEFVFLGLVFIQAVVSQCIQRQQNYGCGLSGYGNGLGSISLSGGNYPLPSGPPPQPVGIFVTGDNLIIDGYLDVTGSLPFQGAIVVEGALPTQGLVQGYYGCGDGNVGINEAGTTPFGASRIGTAINPNAGVGISANIGLNNLNGCGCV